MSLFLIVPEEDRGLAELLPILGADERMGLGSWSQMAGTLREAAGGATSRSKNWTLFEVPAPDDERLAMVADAVSEQVGAQGEAVLDLEVKMLTVAELQAVAAGLGLSIGLVAVLKPKAGSRPPHLDGPDKAILAAIAELGGTASTGQLAARLERPKVALRKRLCRAHRQPTPRRQTYGDGRASLQMPCMF